MKWTSRSGITLIELLIAAGLVVPFILAATYTLIIVGKTSNRVTSRGETELQMGLAMQHLLRVGRMAQNCTKVAGTLECQIADGPSLSRVRFALNGTTIDYDRFDSTASTWNNETQYSGITAFDICSDADMTAGTCPLGNSQIGTIHASNLIAAFPTPPSRFFRVQLKCRTTQGSEQSREVALRSAVFVRASPGISYLWGTRK